ncbi:MAG: hypothetical protein U1F43_32650 [Myxococcota bacterium]
MADGYDALGYPDRYRFEQSLANQFDGYAIDLIAGAFYPVLYAADDAADSLYLDLPERVWSEAHP